jgi:hypothetical protein
LRIFRIRWFDRFARKEGIDDRDLFGAVARAERGAIDADLGGGLIKQRGARKGAACSSRVPWKPHGAEPAARPARQVEELNAGGKWIEVLDEQ